MEEKLLILSALIMSLFLIPFAYSLEAQSTYNCTNGNLVTNVTAMINGELNEIYFDNETCPFGCALNGLECNDPRNVDFVSMSSSALIFLAVGIVFLFLSYKVEPISKRYYVIKYLYLALFFIYMIMMTGILGGLSIFGQNNFSNIMWTNYYILIFTTIVTFLLIFFTEVEEWYKSMRHAMGDRK
jgi:hypothetical protein